MHIKIKCKMGKTILIAIALMLGHFNYVQPTSFKMKANESYVYICTGPYAKKYHKTSSCKGLDNCSESVKKVTENYAIDKGRTRCKICYK